MENQDIFNLKLEDFQTEEIQSKGNQLYKPDPKNGKDNIYRAVVRFLPRVENPKQSAIKKFTYWLEDSSGNGSYYDSPKSISWDEKCRIADLYYKLSKSKSAADQKAAERLQRKEYYFSLVQIIKDPQNPEMEGTIQVYRYPKTIKKIVDAQTTPSKEDMAMGQEPCNVFDLYEGKNFNIKVTVKGGYWNYDECKFGDSKTALTIDGTVIERTPESQKVALAYLSDTPNIKMYEYKAIDAEKDVQLTGVLSDIDTSNPGASYNAIASSNQAVKPAAVSTPVSTPTPDPVASLDAVNDAAKPVDDLDDFLNGLNA